MKKIIIIVMIVINRTLRSLSEIDTSSAADGAIDFAACLLGFFRSRGLYLRILAGKYHKWGGGKDLFIFNRHSRDILRS